MEKVFFIIKMVINMKVILLMIKKKDLVFFILNLEILGKVLFMMIKWMVKGFLKEKKLGKLLILMEYYKSNFNKIIFCILIYLYD